MRTLFFSLFIVLLIISNTVQAQNPDFLQDKPTNSKKRKKGWYPMLKTSGNLSWANSKDVVGQTDGSTWNIGYILTGQLIYLSKENHEWKNDLGWQLNYVKTPLTDKFSKSMDNVELSSAWLYHLKGIKWLGPYGQMGLKSSLFSGYMINASGAPLDVQKLASDGNPLPNGLTTYQPQDTIKLTNALSPTVLKQSLGIFLNPTDLKYLKTYVQLGGGAWEIYGRNGFVVDDNSETAPLEIKQIDDTVQIGAELNLTATGTIKKIINYGIKANFMLPFYNNSQSNLSGIDLLNTDLEFKAGVKISKFVSIEYSFKAVKYPLITDKWQILNGLVISFNASIIEPPAKKKKVKMCPCKPEAALKKEK
ncbi:MAG: DUF3078 domain-containing protein [Deltaproteobacteria bacterium]|nr:DUF3078 domain-containing protein [Deltaproteobacteria bacterium]